MILSNFKSKILTICILVCVLLLSFLAYVNLYRTGSQIVVSKIEHEHAALTRAQEFLNWLEENKIEFANCFVQKKSNSYILCDNTEISQQELQKLFSLSAAELLTALQNKNLSIQILCEHEPLDRHEFKDLCQEDPSSDAAKTSFEKLTSLHGQYIPETQNIYLRSSSSRGSLIHEYIHHLQSQNTQPVYGKVYKQKRNQIQKELVQIMDEKIAIIERLEREKSPEALGSHLNTFMKASDTLRAFSKWQDLIDERSIFELYIRFADELQISPQDLALAQLNMRHICLREDLKEFLSNNDACNIP